MMADIGDVRGYHILADLWGCPRAYLEDVDKLRELLFQAAEEGLLQI